MINASALNLEYLTRDTISSHPWHRTEEWTIDGYNSLWTLEPQAIDAYGENGEVYVVKMCLITCSADMVLNPENSMIIEGYLYDGGSPIPIIEFKYLDEMINRASKIDYFNIANITGGSSMTRPFYKIELPFAQEILLWGSAGINMQT